MSAMYAQMLLEQSVAVSPCQADTEATRCQALALDLTQIKRQLQQRQWSTQRILRACDGYVQFLKTVREKPHESARPTPDVDEVWHLHILDTRKYAQDCETMLGFFLHHLPDPILTARWMPPSAQGPLPQSWWQRLLGLSPQFATCGSGGNQGT